MVEEEGGKRKEEATCRQKRKVRVGKEKKLVSRKKERFSTEIGGGSLGKIQRERGEGKRKTTRGCKRRSKLENTRSTTMKPMKG